jgi:hypothetical protein
MMFDAAYRLLPSSSTQFIMFIIGLTVGDKTFAYRNDSLAAAAAAAPRE